MMNKFAIFSYNPKAYNRSSNTIPQRLVETFPDNFIYPDVDVSKFDDYEAYRKEGYRIFLPTQKIDLFSKLVYIEAINDVIYIRKEAFLKRLSFLSTYSNGFSTWKSSVIKTFIPDIYENFSFIERDFSKPVVGFYACKSIKPDSYVQFIDFVNKTKGIDFYVLGDEIPELYSNVNYKHTTDSKKFFKEITHFWYFLSNVFEDPFPNTLLEATLRNIRPIIPENKRNFSDGIDDILSCIEFSKDLFDDKIIDNSESILNFSNFESFYKKLIQNNWNLSVDKIKYKNFYEWCVGEVI